MYHTSFLSTKYISWFVSLLIFCYFIYHTYHGERGLIAQEALEAEYADLQKTYKELHTKRVSLENKITSLGAGTGEIDRDLLSENAKKQGYIFPDEILITD